MDRAQYSEVNATAPQDPQYVEALIEAYGPLVKYLAHWLADRLSASIGLEDLISAGALGLLEAIQTYDPARAASFKTYAERRIQGAMLDYVREYDWVPRSVRQKEHALTEAYAALERQQGWPADDAAVADWLGLDRDTFDHWLTEVRGVSVLSLDTPLESHSEGPALTAQELKQHLGEAIDALPQQEKVVLSLYYCEELTMREIGQVLEVTELRIAQIRTTAIFHLRAALQNLAQGAYATVA